jgi:translation initiation factor 3 subunit L
MSLRQGIQSYQQDVSVRIPEDDSDAEEDVLVNDYKEQVRYDQNGLDDLTQTSSHGGGGGGGQDIHAQLAAAATPLEFQATLETKFASYDNYCSLFHFILNSEGPVDLEVPSVYISATDL